MDLSQAYDCLPQTFSLKLEQIKTMFYTKFNYCIIFWHFTCNLQTKMIQITQERPLHFIYNDNCPSYDSLLTASCCPPLNIRRLVVMSLYLFI